MEEGARVEAIVEEAIDDLFDLSAFSERLVLKDFDIHLVHPDIRDLNEDNLEDVRVDPKVVFLSE